MMQENSIEWNMFIERVLKLWDAGMNTFDIAQKFGLPATEAKVERALHQGREQRRKREQKEVEWKPRPIGE